MTNQAIEALDTKDRDVFDRVRASAAWDEAERERDAERTRRHRELVKERAALQREQEKTLASLNSAHMEALARVEEAEAKLKTEKAAALEAERAAYQESFAARRAMHLIEADLVETAPACIAEAREWAKTALDDGIHGYKKLPGHRVVKGDRGQWVSVPKREEYAAAVAHVAAMRRTDSGPLFDLEMSDLPPAKVAERVAEIKAEGERLIAAALSNEKPIGPVRAVVETVRKIRDVHEARAEARRAAAGEIAAAAG